MSCLQQILYQGQPERDLRIWGFGKVCCRSLFLLGGLVELVDVLRLLLILYRPYHKPITHHYESTYNVSLRIQVVVTILRQAALIFRIHFHWISLYTVGSTRLCVLACSTKTRRGGWVQGPIWHVHLVVRWWAPGKMLGLKYVPFSE